MIKTIVIDLGGVYFANGTEVALQKIPKKYGISREEAEFILRKSKEVHLYRKGKLSQIRFWNFVRKELHTDRRTALNIRKTYYDCYKPNKGMKELVSRLYKKCRLVVFSGNIKDRVNYLDKKYDFLQYFDDTLFSFDAGFNKGDLEFYKMLLQKLKCKPQEAIFVDNEKENLAMAKFLGIKTAMFENASQLKKSLVSSGMKV